MSKKVEDYIQEHTRNGINIAGNPIHAVSTWNYHSWLTPDDARAVAQIAREEVIEKAVEFLKSYRREYPDGKGYIPGIVDDETIENFKKYMEDSV